MKVVVYVDGDPGKRWEGPGPGKDRQPVSKGMFWGELPRPLGLKLWEPVLQV